MLDLGQKYAPDKAEGHAEEKFFAPGHKFPNLDQIKIQYIIDEA